MIKIKTHLKEFESVIKIIGNISNETDYVFSPEGLKIRAIDPSSTYMVVFTLSKDTFDSYEVEEEKILTLNNDLFAKIIKKVGKTELDIDFLEDAITLGNKKESFSLKFFVGQKDDRPDPNPPCTSVWKTKCTDFTKTITELSSLGTICCLDGTDKLAIKIKSNMVEGEVLTTAEKIIEGDDCFCYYDISYITPIVESKNIFKDLRVGFGEELPLVIKGDNEYLNFVFVLAARVE